MIKVALPLLCFVTQSPPRRSHFDGPISPQKRAQLSLPNLDSDLDPRIDARIAPKQSKDDAINAARQTLSFCWFDAAACSEGLTALRSYRKDWDEERGVWRDTPRHDKASHGSDTFQALSADPQMATFGLLERLQPGQERFWLAKSGSQRRLARGRQPKPTPSAHLGTVLRPRTTSAQN
jgi:hypothetical protein